MYPLIINYKRNSLDDGPGIRTVIFFKGCPLSCVWCQNPESKSQIQEIKYNEKNCLKCKNCVEVCPNDAIDVDLEYPIIKGRCNLCGNCIEACEWNTLMYVGNIYSIDEIVTIAEKDKVFYDNTGGGITLSGGEPTLYPNYLGKLLPRIKEKKIHICLETSGYYKNDEFSNKILPYIDLIYFDLKLYDSQVHKKYCKVENNRILENFEYLIHNSHIEILPRIPLIPDITTTSENLKALADYLKSLNINNIALLPYNPLWISKLKSIGANGSYTNSKWMTKEEKERVISYFKDFQFKPI